MPVAEVDTAIASREGRLANEFADYLGVPIETPLATLDEAREILRDIEDNTGARPALVYISFLPEGEVLAGTETQFQATALAQGKAFGSGGGSANLAGLLEWQFGALAQALSPEAAPDFGPRDSDQLEVLVVTAEGDPIFQRVPGATRSRVMAIASELRAAVANPDATTSDDYLLPAQQLYEWIIEPVRQRLEQREINNLVFLMEAGLRSTPMAALHNGQQFLVEDFSVGLMPSLTLTDTRYRDIRDTQVLGMGVSESTQDQPPLPAVPAELAAIEQLWQGRALLNESFTIDRLKALRTEQPYGIIHLATHADFEPGPLANSYVQFWNNRLKLDQLRTLGLANPPVELLVLSACRTALGNEDAELGFAGFAVKAGVKSAIASLWFVNDAATAGLMTELYGYLRTAPIKAEALREAQLSMARGQITLEDGKLQGLAFVPDMSLPPESADLVSDRVLSHPYYWAGFTLIGNPW